MKKSVFFAIFLSILSFGAFFYSTKAHAEGQEYNITISAKMNSTTLNEEYFNPQTNTLSINYSELSSAENNTITLTADVTSINQDAPGTILSYEWKLGDNILSTQSKLILNTKILKKDDNLLLIGESRYTLTIRDPNTNAEQQKLIKVVVKAQSSEYKVLTLKDGINNTVTRNSEPFSLHAYLPVATNHSIIWMIKLPNQVTYTTISEQSSVTINPKDLLSSQFNMCVLDFIAVATHGTNTYYSEKISIQYVPKFYEDTTPNTTGYKIQKNEAENTKASIEATKFSIINGENLNCEHILWYVENTLVANGASFIYEPTTKETYVVKAKYFYTTADGKSNIAELDSVEITPKATNTWILFVSIGATVVVLSIILAISIIHTNKKRDVVW